MLAQYKQVEKASGKTPEKLKEYRKNDVPRRFRYLLDYFFDACNGGEYTHSELLAWMQIKKLALKAWEIDCIKSMWLERDSANADYQKQITDNIIKRTKGKK